MSIFKKREIPNPNEGSHVAGSCPRCGRRLRDAEEAEPFEATHVPSAVLRLEITACPADSDLTGVKLSVWTMAPWTLVANMGLAIYPPQTYTIVNHDGEMLVVAEPLRKRMFQRDAVLADLPGDLLIGARYIPPYETFNEGTTHTIVPSNFVSMDAGTGILHLAPALSVGDREIGQANGWPTYDPLDAHGRFTQQAPQKLQGLSTKDADTYVIGDLQRRGILLSADTYSLKSPLCSQCEIPTRQ